MSEGGPNSGNPPGKKPKIIKLGNFGRTNPIADSENNPTIVFEKGEISIEPSMTFFEPNQTAEITDFDDGTLEVTILQKGSTPGLRTKLPIHLGPGEYSFTVVGYANSDSTFFPWAMDSEGVRLTPTIHIPTEEEPVTVNFKVASNSQVFFGVLCHRQELDDKCFISSFHIAKSPQTTSSNSRGSFKSIQYSELIAHQNTNLSVGERGTNVRSIPISTPGAYAIIDVTPNSTITIFLRVSIVYPSVAFLYAADAKSGIELIKRNIIFESLEDSGEGEYSELYSSVKIPSSVSQIRLGLLFSTVSKPKEHEMTIHSFEVSEYKKLSDVVDEAYVINLKGEEEKLKFCQFQADRFDFSFTRWEAINGDSEPYLSKWREYMDTPWNKLDKKLGRKAIDRKGAWGYLLSMQGIFLDAIEKKHNSIAIFDDDFILSKSFDHRFSKLIELIGEPWDVIYLGASQWLWDGISNDGADFYIPNENTNGSFGVIYHKRVFEKIVREIELMEAPFDAGALRKVTLGTSRERSFVANPNMVIANLEKPGIRESRNQFEFSKRFAWDLEDFPAGFSSWSSEPVVLRDIDCNDGGEGHSFVTGVTTVNRIEYLQRFVSDWLSTKSTSANSTLIVADDGSSDGTLEWLEELEIKNSRLIVIRNNGSGIARQSNSILDAISKMKNDIDAVFMCNDDIRFLESGWDVAYFESMQSSGFDHLVYFNPQWKEPSHSEEFQGDADLASFCTPREAMGCFYTLTPNLIERLGFFDEASFPVRGHSHVDYTMRACRCEANDGQFLFDMDNSNTLIGMVLREGYKRTFRTLSVKEMHSTTSENELAKRETVLLTEDRIFVPRGW